jgi:hypothetical protein
MSSLFNNAYALGPNQTSERLYVYIAGGGTYWVMISNDPIITIPDALATERLRNDGIKLIDIKLSSVSRWRNVYNYFIEGVWYTNTNLTEVPSNYAELRILFGESPDLTVANNIARYLSDLLRMRFFLINASESSYRYVSALNATYNYNEFSETFNIGFEGVFSLTNTLNLASRDYSSIQLYIDAEKDVIKLVMSGMNYQTISATGDYSLRAVFPLLGLSSVRNDINITEVVFLMKNVYISEYPDSLSMEYDKDSSLYILRQTVPVGQGIPDIRLKFHYYYPELLIQRTFNVTSFVPGSYIQVSLEVSNIGSLPAINLLLEESRWWDNYDFVSYVSGTTSLLIDNLDPGATRTIRYKIKLDESAQGNILISPASASLDIMDGSKTLYYASSSSIIHIGTDTPLLSVTLEDIEKFNINIGDEFEAYITVRNLGNAAIQDLVIANVYIGTLEPGEERKVRSTYSVFNESIPERIYLENIRYVYGAQEFIISTQSLPLLFTPENTLSPYIIIEENITKTVDGVVIEYTIKNEGTKDIDNILLTGFIDETLSYTGNLSRIGNRLEGMLAGLGIGEAKTITLYISSIEQPSFLLPELLIQVENIYGTIEYKPNTHVYMAAIELLQITPGEIILKGVKYNHSFIIKNLDEYNIYSIQIKVDYGGLTVSNESALFIEVLEGGQEVKISNVIWGDLSGLYTISPPIIKYFYGGEESKLSLEGFNITVYKGLSMNMEYPRSVKEGEPLEVIIKFNRDTDLVANVNIYWELPTGLIFEDGSNVISKTVSFVEDKSLLTLHITSTEPGSYIIEPPEVTFDFLGEKYSLYDVVEKPDSLSITFREDVVRRYWLYFLPMVLITLIIAVYIKRRVEV